jgi:hypothetical protein
MRALKASLATPLGEMWNREGPHRLYATADHTQRDAQALDVLADGTVSARLIVKTVAVPKSLTPISLHFVPSISLKNYRVHSCTL